MTRLAAPSNLPALRSGEKKDSMKRIFGILAAAAAAAGATACGDDLSGPRNWQVTVDTVALYSLARPELQGLPAALDFVASGGRPVVVEALGATGNWDIALSERGGEFVLLPPAAVAGVPETTAAIAVIRDEAFAELARAPSDSAAYVHDAPVPLESGPVYVVRSHQNPNLGSCVYFAKVQLVDTDPSAGVARLRYTRNPLCNDRALVPPDRD